MWLNIQNMTDINLWQGINPPVFVGIDKVKLFIRLGLRWCSYRRRVEKKKIKRCQWLVYNDVLYIDNQDLWLIDWRPISWNDMHILYMHFLKMTLITIDSILEFTFLMFEKNYAYAAVVRQCHNSIKVLSWIIDHRVVHTSVRTFWLATNGNFTLPTANFVYILLSQIWKFWPNKPLVNKTNPINHHTRYFPMPWFYQKNRVFVKHGRICICHQYARNFGDALTFICVHIPIVWGSFITIRNLAVCCGLTGGWLVSVNLILSFNCCILVNAYASNLR